jgi:hypothetical protein
MKVGRASFKETWSYIQADSCGDDDDYDDDDDDDDDRPGLYVTNGDI